MSGTLGALKKKAKGKTTNKKRRPANKKGGTSVTPTLITTKLRPQTIITIRAKNKSLFDNLDKIGPVKIKGVNLLLSDNKLN